jgi:hypothetical protein
VSAIKPSQVPDCCFSLRLHPPAVEVPEVLVVAPTALCILPCPARRTVLYQLVTGYPDRPAHERVFVADLTINWVARSADIWAKTGVDPQAGQRSASNRSPGKSRPVPQWLRQRGL